MFKVGRPGILDTGRACGLEASGRLPSEVTIVRRLGPGNKGGP